jgi:hypothetical protein
MRLKKGDCVTVSEDHTYDGQDMRWTERRTGRVWLENVVLYHASDSKLHGFFPKETCFFQEKRSSGHIYGLQYTGWANEYDGEVRIDLVPGMELKYLGRLVCECDRNSMVPDGFGGFMPKQIWKDHTVAM